MDTLPLKRAFFRYWATTGPQILQAGIELRSEPADKLILDCSASWPDGGDYTEAVFHEIRSVVTEFRPKAFGARITISEVEFNDVGSSMHLFRIVAREAARSLFTTSEPLSEFP